MRDQSRNRVKLTSCVLVVLVASIIIRGASQAKLRSELGLHLFRGSVISDCSSQNVNISEVSLVQLHRNIPLD